MSLDDDAEAERGRARVCTVVVVDMVAEGRTKNKANIYVFSGADPSATCPVLMPVTESPGCVRHVMIPSQSADFN